ncbi:MAG: fused MFS/spermidine synthase [Gemmatimonadaceae bacterium]
MIVLYCAAVFLSAVLLFSIQLIFSKMVLPLLGGTPAVWNTCMLFFQTVLLLGYAYAHVTRRWLGARRQALVHLTLLALASLALPISVAGHRPPATAPIPWLLGLLALSLGVPFLLLSTTAPLLQDWFGRSSHPSAHNPYFLYVASNIGSMLALLSYPILVEPRWPLGDQSTAWTVGYGALIALIAACALALRRRPGPDQGADRATPDVPPVAVSSARRAAWGVLSLVPSSLLLGVTTYITTDVAAVPLLWVLPLALYLLTFVLTFASRPIIPHRVMVMVQPYLVLLWVVPSIWGSGSARSISLPLHLLLFFVTAMVCHGELARRRPPASRLTEFFLWVALGGMLGGVFNVLIAPTIFDRVIEYPLALIAACMVRPRAVARSSEEGGARPWLDVALPAALFIALAGTLHLVTTRVNVGQIGIVAIAIVAALSCFSFGARPVRFGLGVAAVFAAHAAVTQLEAAPLTVKRSFFSVYTVRESADARYHLLAHGTTTHGAQRTDAAGRLEPLSYYTRAGPVGQLFATRGLDPGAHVAVIGLGTGSLSCYGLPEQEWTYYEIDPLVERIARDERYFTFLRDCPPRTRVVLGDARVSLERAPAGSYDLVVLDAFSSDAIPVHLLTREAIRVYTRALRDGGLLVIHISNRHLALEPVVAALARDAGLAARVQSWRPTTAAERTGYVSASKWIVLGRRAEDLGPLAADARWRALRERSDVGPWTDDFSNIIRVFNRGL